MCIPMSRRRDKNLTPNCPPKQDKQFRIYIYGQSEFNEIMKRFVEVIQDWNKLSTQNYGKKESSNVIRSVCQLLLVIAQL
jgi:hypothetical protein